MALFSTRTREQLGTALGWSLAPLFAVTSRLRRARTFHPTGMVFSAVVEPVALGITAGDTLRGPALVRFSSALWKGQQTEVLDALGCAVRFRRTDDPSPDPDRDDQDLLFATIRSPWTLLLAPFATDVHDFLANDYDGVSPFDVPGVGRAYLRLHPDRRVGGAASSSRAERLLAAVARGEAKMTLQVRAEGTRDWRPIATITLRGLVDFDQARLEFWPFRVGRGFVPRGFVHALRRGVYAASQYARPSSGE